MSAVVSRARDPLVTEYLAHLVVERNASPTTERSYSSVLYLCERWLAARRPPDWRLASASVADLRAWLAGQAPRIAASTRHTRLAILRSFYDYLVKEGYRPDNPARQIERPKLPKRVPNILPVEAVRQLLDAPWGRPWPGWRNRACAELLYGCGLRVSEGAGLRLDDLDLERRTVRVFGKGAKERVLPIPARAADHLETWLSLRPCRARPEVRHVFVGHTGDPLTAKGIWRAIVLRARRLGLPHIHPHRLRAARATHLIQHHGDPRAVQALLGHARFETTERYYLAVVQLDEIAAMMATADPLASAGS